MLFLCWLMFRGAWEQTVINWGTTSAVMQVSMGWFYLSGVVFAVLAAVILGHDLWRLATGQLSEGELVAISDSEDELPPEAAHPAAAAR